MLLAHRNDIHIKHPLRWRNEAEVDGVSRDPEFPASGHCWQKLLLHNEGKAVKLLGTSVLQSMHPTPVRPPLHLAPNICVLGRLRDPHICPHLYVLSTCSLEEHFRHPNLPPPPLQVCQALLQSLTSMVD